jgi:hypothetical protein
MRLRTGATTRVSLIAAVFIAGAGQLFTADSAIAQQCQPSDFVTGGGFIVFADDAHGNFGVAGGCQNGAFWGHLNYLDHSTQPPFHVRGTSVTGYFQVDPTTRDITGTAETNDPSFPTVSYCVRVTDNGKGESGTGGFFGIQLIENGYLARGALGGGNTQLHNGNPPPSQICFGVGPPP